MKFQTQKTQNLYWLIFFPEKKVYNRNVRIIWIRLHVVLNKKNNNNQTKPKTSTKL